MACEGVADRPFWVPLPPVGGGGSGCLPAGPRQAGAVSEV